jgi:DNA-binding transcriptional ArsR family regulator
VLILALPAAVAIWSGWVGLGQMAGFGPVRLLPGIADQVVINSAITLPVGMEAYSAYALHVWLSPGITRRAASFARTSAIGALLLGSAGQVAYHLLSAANVTTAPWPVVAVVACLPVAVLGMGAALAHLVREPVDQDEPASSGQPVDQGEPAGQEPAPVERQDQGIPIEHEDQGGPVESQPVPASVVGPARARKPRPRTTGRSGRSAAERIDRARARYPEAGTAEIARRVGVSDRTVRRHLNPPQTDTGPVTGPVADSAARAA